MVLHRRITAVTHPGFGYVASHPPSLFHSQFSLERESPVKQRCRTSRQRIAAPVIGVVDRTGGRA
jgi:hypothetical protein